MACLLLKQFVECRKFTDFEGTVVDVLDGCCLYIKGREISKKDEVVDLRIGGWYSKSGQNLAKCIIVEE